MVNFFNFSDKLSSHKIEINTQTILQLDDPSIHFIKKYNAEFNRNQLDIKSIIKFIYKKDRKKFKEKCRFLFKFQKEIDDIFRFQVNNRRIFYFRILINSKLKNFPLFQCIILDITGEYEFKEKFYALNACLKESRSSIMVVEPDPYKKLKIIYVNEYFESMTGYFFSEVYGKNPNILQGPETSKETLQFIRKNILTETAFQCEVLNYRSDHSMIWISLNCIPYFNEDKELEYWMSLSRDITDKKKAEIENQKILNEIIKSSKIQALGKMASGVSHDFNNLLSAIGLYTDLIEESSGDSDNIKTYSKNIKEIIYRANELTINLQSFAREVPSLKNKININDYLESTKSFLKLILGKTNTLEIYHWNKNCIIELDKPTLTHIFSNICMNAKDSFTTSGILEIHIIHAIDIPIELQNLDPEKKPLEYILVKFVDNGRGIQEEHLDQIFEPFFSTKPYGDANGLGLASIYGIIKENKGHIAVQSNVGIGTTFEIYLPKV